MTMHEHDGYEPHSHEIRPDHLGVNKKRRGYRKSQPGVREGAKRYEIQVIVNVGTTLEGAVLVDRCTLEAETLAEAAYKYAALFPGWLW